jgi:hypothetical protein
MTEQNQTSQTNGKISWDILYKISQLAVFPALAVIFYMLTQLGNLDRRITITELVQSSRPNFAEMVAKQAIFDERQKVNTSRIETLEKSLDIHKSKSPYEKQYNNK